MLEGILPERLYAALMRAGMDDIYEIRVRANCPVTVNCRGKFTYLSKAGTTRSAGEALVADQSAIDAILYKATNYSVYAVNNQLRQGFVALPGGARLGVAGEAVTENGEISTIKNVTSVVIRVPHSMPGCASTAFRFIRKKSGEAVYNTLLLSPPGAGKTTFLRDIARSVWEMNPLLNTLIVDERGEITAPAAGKLAQYAGGNVDVLFGASKAFSFTAGIRSLRPDVIVTDELGDGADVEAVALAMTAGVSVVASVHAACLEDLSNKPAFSRLLERRLFERFVVLSTRNGAGTIEGIFDGKGVSLFFTA